jgi:hypothetical protein
MAIRWRHQATKGTFNNGHSQGCFWFGLILFDVDKKIF